MDFATCDHCSYERWFSHPLRSYGTPDKFSDAVTIRWKYAFCKQCSQVVEAEDIPTLEELDAQLKEIAGRNDGSHTGKFPASDSDISRWIAGIQKYIEWRKTRVSSPRCLECGSGEITFFNVEESEDRDDIESLEHPNCGGTISIRRRGFDLNRSWLFYTPEGMKLADYDVFPYKGLVKRD